MRDVTRACLCPCTDIITFGLWRQDVLCLGVLGSKTEGRSFIVNWPAIHNQKPRIQIRQRLWQPWTHNWACCPVRWMCLLPDRRIQPASRLELFFWQKKKAFNWQYLRKTDVLNCLFTSGWLLGLQFPNFSSVYSRFFSLPLFFWGWARPFVPKTSMGKQAVIAETSPS